MACSGLMYAGRADDDADLCHVRALGGAQRPGDAEVGHPGVPRGQQDVLRLDVAMDDAPRMGVVERVGHLPRDPAARRRARIVRSRVRRSRSDSPSTKGMT